MEVEPVLLPYDGEHLQRRSANRSGEARLDLRARGFWTRQQDAFFDVRITHPRATLLSRLEVLSHLKDHERSKKRQYCERVNQIDRGTFTPLVFATNGICSPETNRFLKALAALLVDKHKGLSYSVAMGGLRSLLSFALLRWAVTCFRGCRGSYGRRRATHFVDYCLSQN